MDRNGKKNRRAMKRWNVQSHSQRSYTVIHWRLSISKEKPMSSINCGDPDEMTGFESTFWPRRLPQFDESHPNGNMKNFPNHKWGIVPCLKGMLPRGQKWLPTRIWYGHPSKGYPNSMGISRASRVPTPNRSNMKQSRQRSHQFPVLNILWLRFCNFLWLQ